MKYGVWDVASLESIFEIKYVTTQNMNCILFKNGRLSSRDTLHLEYIIHISYLTEHLLNEMQFQIITALACQEIAP